MKNAASPRPTRPLWAFAAAALALLAAPAAASADEPEIDQGNFIVRHNGKALGAESFAFQRTGDSLTVRARVYETLPTPDGDQTLEKDLIVVVGSSDFAIRMYQSTQKFLGHKLTRALTINDTSFTAYREVDGYGRGDTRVLPPGRTFVVDPQLFTLFDLMCRSLQGQTFDRRPISLLVMGDRDSMHDATVVDLGSETIRWGARPVTARKVRISDYSGEFTAWVGPRGNMLKLENAAAGLVVEREAAAVKRREPPPPPRPPGG